MNFFVIILFWQHNLYLCTFFLVQGGKWTLVHLPPCTRNNVHKYRISCHNNIITKKFLF